MGEKRVPWCHVHWSSSCPHPGGSRGDIVHWEVRHAVAAIRWWTGEVKVKVIRSDIGLAVQVIRQYLEKLKSIREHGSRGR